MQNFNSDNFQSSKFFHQPQKCYYPEDVTLNVETMTFSKIGSVDGNEKKEDPFAENRCQNCQNPPHQNSFSGGFNFGNLFENLKNNPLSALLGGKSAFSDLLKGGLAQSPLSLQTVASILTNNKAEKEKQKEKEEIIEIDSFYEDI